MTHLVTFLLVIIISLLSYTCLAAVSVLPCSSEFASPCSYANAQYLHDNTIQLLSNVVTEEEQELAFARICNDRWSKYRLDGNFYSFVVNASDAWSLAHPEESKVNVYMYPDIFDAVKDAPLAPQYRWVTYNIGGPKVARVSSVISPVDGTRLVIGSGYNTANMSVLHGCLEAESSTVCSYYNSASLLGRTLHELTTCKSVSELQSEVNRINEEQFQSSTSYYSFVTEYVTGRRVVHKSPGYVNTTTDASIMSKLRLAVDTDNGLNWAVYSQNGKPKISQVIKVRLFGVDYVVGSGFSLGNIVPTDLPCNSQYYSDCAMQNARLLVGNVFGQIAGITADGNSNDLTNFFASINNNQNGEFELDGGLSVSVAEVKTGRIVAHPDPTKLNTVYEPNIRLEKTIASSSPYSLGFISSNQKQFTEMSILARVSAFNTSYWIETTFGTEPISHNDTSSKNSTNTDPEDISNLVSRSTTAKVGIGAFVAGLIIGLAGGLSTALLFGWLYWGKKPLSQAPKVGPQSDL